MSLANLTWKHVELHTGTINVLTKKTSRRQILPIAEPLSRHLQTLAGDTHENVIQVAELGIEAPVPTDVCASVKLLRNALTPTSELRIGGSAASSKSVVE